MRIILLLSWADLLRWTIGAFRVLERWTSLHFTGPSYTLWNELSWDSVWKPLYLLTRRKGRATCRAPRQVLLPHEYNWIYSNEARGTSRLLSNHWTFQPSITPHCSWRFCCPAPCAVSCPLSPVLPCHASSLLLEIGGYFPVDITPFFKTFEWFLNFWHGSGQNPAKNDPLNPMLSCTNAD